MSRNTRYVDQPTKAPTRKLTAAMLGASGAGIVKALVVNAWPHLADPTIWEPLPYVFGFAIGYVVKERDNAVTPNA